MIKAKHWTIDIHIDEHEERTRASARLRTWDQTKFEGVGTARLNPTDANIPEIGDELAAARALADLAHQLLEATATDIESVTHEPTHLAR